MRIYLITIAIASLSAIAMPLSARTVLVEKAYRTQSTTNGGGGSSNGSNAVNIQRVVHADGSVHTTYAAPRENDAEPESEQTIWYWPFTVVERTDGTRSLLDRPLINKRIDRFLQQAGWTRKDCGKWGFSWTAYQVECDPDFLLKLAESYRLPDKSLQTGAILNLGEEYPAIELICAETWAGIVTCTGTAPLDPERVRTSRAETAVAVASIRGEALTYDDAILAEQTTVIDGTFAAQVLVDNEGQTIARETVVQLLTLNASGEIEYQTSCEWLTGSGNEGVQLAMCPFEGEYRLRNYSPEVQR